MDEQIEFLETLLKFVRGLRRGRNFRLARAALDEEQQLEKRLHAARAQLMPQAVGFAESRAGDADPDGQ